MEKVRSANNAERAAAIVTDPTTIVEQAVENARPLMQLQRIERGAVEYRVSQRANFKRSSKYLNFAL